jgi:hypothetical protein
MSLIAADAMGQSSLAPDACRGTPLTAVEDYMDETPSGILAGGGPEVFWRWSAPGRPAFADSSGSSRITRFTGQSLPDLPFDPNWSVAVRRRSFLALRGLEIKPKATGRHELTLGSRCGTEVRQLRTRRKTRRKRMAGVR